MSTITATDINKLRQATGAGMMDCRKALTETNNDFEAAIDWLRKQGQKVAAKRSDREAKEGVIIAQTSADNKTGFVVCISCETDFVSKNAEFVAFAQSIADAAVANNVKSADELNEVMINGAKVSDMINDKLASIGEKIGVAKFERVEAAYVASYIHGANRMGVLVGLNKEAAEAGRTRSQGDPQENLRSRESHRSQGAVDHERDQRDAALLGQRRLLAGRDRPHD